MELIRLGATQRKKRKFVPSVVVPSTQLNTNIGVNLAWLEFGYKSPIKQHAFWDVPHIPSTVQSFAESGLGLIRLPILWERIQPVLEQPLDDTHVAIIRAFLDDCAAYNLDVILDIHNYCRYATAPIYNITNVTGTFSVGDTINAYTDNTKASLRASAKVVKVDGNAISCSKFQLINPVLNSVVNMGSYVETSGGATADVVSFTGESTNQFGHAEIPESAFNDLWIRLITELGTHPAVKYADIMNEPPGSLQSVNGEAPAAIWLRYAQSCANAIRTINNDVTLLIEGLGWSAGHQWAANNPNIHTFVDPANNFKWSFHNYMDSDNSGTNFDVPLSTTIGSSRASAMVAWAESHGYTGADLHWGELGASDGGDWNLALEDALTYAESQGIIVTGWAAGHMWGSYGYSLEPQTLQSRIVQRNQIGIYQKAFNIAGVVKLFDSGLDYSATNVPTDITVFMRGYSTTPIVVDIAVTGSAVTNVNQITLPAGVNTSATYTVTSATGSSVIEYSRADGGDVPPNRGFSVGDSPTETANKLRIYSLVKEVGSYTGNCLIAHKQVDGVWSSQEFDFSGLNRGSWVDYAAIETWANGEEVRVELLDQTGSGEKLGMRISSGGDVAGGFPTPSPADLPVLEFNSLGDKPSWNMSGSILEARIAAANKTQMTLVAHVNPRNYERLAAWDFTDNYTWFVNQHTLSFDAAGGSDEITKTLPTGATLNQWQVLTFTDDRTQNIGTFGSFGKRTSYKNGIQVAQTDNYFAKITMQYNKPSTMAVGWFRWYAPLRLEARMTRLMLFGETLNSDQVQAQAAEIVANV